MNASAPFGVRFTRSWVSTYTSGLPAEAGERRRMEIESDIHEQLQMMGTQGVLGRCLRGIPADVWWRTRTLLERAGQAERNPNMTNNPNRKLWIGLVAVHVLLLTALGGIPDGAYTAATVFTIAALVGSVVVVAGVVVQKSRFVTGSWMVVVGLIPTMVSITGPLVLVSGLWTANLALTEKTAELSHEVLSSRRAHALGQEWWHWFAASAILFAVGFGALVVMGDGQTATSEDDTSLLKGLAWLAWLLSWLGAVTSAGLGVVQGIARHRTRSA